MAIETIYNLQKEQLIKIIARSSDVIRDVNFNSVCEDIDDITQELNTKKINVLVLGGICTGKSTVINALLGKEILPANVLPSLPVMTEVQYGDNKKAVLYFNNPLPEKLPLNILPAKIKEHIQLQGMKDVPPLCIDFGEVESVILSAIEGDPFELWNYPIFNKLEIFVPSDILKEGLVFIEMPGFNETNMCLKMKTNIMAKADAILFVFGADHLCTMDEMVFIDNYLYANGFNNPLFVINRCDLFSEKEIRELREFAKIKLQKYSSNEITCISALLALEGELRDNESHYKESGMELLKEKLSELLYCDREKRKLLQYAHMLKRILNDDILNRTIPKQLSILNSSYEEIKNRCEILASGIQELKSGQDRITIITHRLSNQVHNEIKSSFNGHVLSIMKEIPQWIEEFSPVNTLGIFSTQKRFAIIANEIIEATSERIHDANITWLETVIKPFINKAILNIIESVESELIVLFEMLDSLSSHFVCQEKTKRDVTSFWKKSLGAEVDAYVDSMFISLRAETYEKTDNMTSCNLYFHPIPIYNPFYEITLCVLGRWNGIKKLKNKISEEIVKYIDERSEDYSNQFVEPIRHKFVEMEKSIIVALSQEMSQMEMLQNTITDELKHRESVINELRQAISKIKNICAELDAFILSLVSSC